VIATKAEPRFFEGWYVVASVFVLLMVNAGLGFYGLSVFLDAITEEQGFSTADVSFATSIFFIVSAISGRLIAPVIQRHDLRIVVAIGAVIAASGLWLIGQSTQLVALYLSYVVFAIGVGLSGLVPGTTLVTRWFQAKRSVALSVASTGLSVGGLTITVLASTIIDRKGMSGAAPWLSLIYLVVVAISLIALWPDPASRGMLPDGGVSIAGRSAPTPTGSTYADAVGSVFFKMVTFGFVLAMGAQVGGIAQLFKLGNERADAGAQLVFAVAFASVVARLIGGLVASRVQLIAMTSVLAAIQGLSLIWLSQSHGKGVLIVAAVLFGCTIGNLLMLQPLVLADRFGVASYPKIFAFSQLIVTGFGVAGGPYLLGWLHDVSSYTASYLAAAGLSFGGSVMFFLAWRFAPAHSLAADKSLRVSPVT
jgi:MFS family permease